VRPASAVVELAVGLALALAASGCTRTTELLADTTALSCTAPGPSVHLGGTGDAACAGVIAAQASRYALCACNDLVLTGSFIVNSLGAPTSRGGGQPPPTPPSTASPAVPSPWPSGPVNGLLPKSFFAAVGTDGNLQVAGHGDFPGALVTAGTGDVQFGREGHVLGNAHLGGTMRSLSSYWISGDGFVGGDVSGRLTVGGALHVPTASTIAPEVHAPTTVREPVTVAPPCNCAAGPAFDVAAAVAARSTKNANTFSQDLLDDVETPQQLDWTCGEYFVDTIHSVAGGTLDFRVHGHVGLFVAGDVRLGDILTVTLDEGATLDLVVAGSFYSTGRVFGSPSTPAGTRLWVGSTTVSLPDQVQFGAFVYAPTAVLSAGVGMSFSGSLFVGTLSVGGDVRIAYDPTLLLAGAACGADAPAHIE
jgi:hypothetical protein